MKEDSGKLFYIVNTQVPIFSLTGGTFNGLISGKNVLVWKERSGADQYIRTRLDPDKFGIVASSESLLFECSELLSSHGFSIEYQD